MERILYVVDVDSWSVLGTSVLSRVDIATGIIPPAKFTIYATTTVVLSLLGKSTAQLVVLSNAVPPFVTLLEAPVVSDVPENEGGVNVGLIVGVTVGCFVAVVLLVWFMLKWYRNWSSSEETMVHRKVRRDSGGNHDQYEALKDA